MLQTIKMAIMIGEDQGEDEALESFVEILPVSSRVRFFEPKSVNNEEGQRASRAMEKGVYRTNGWRPLNLNEAPCYGSRQIPGETVNELLLRPFGLRAYNPIKEVPKNGFSVVIEFVTNSIMTLNP